MEKSPTLFLTTEELAKTVLPEARRYLTLPEAEKADYSFSSPLRTFLDQRRRVLADGYSDDQLLLMGLQGHL